MGQWQPALDAFEAMAPCGVKPDAVTYGALIAASDRGNQWCRALQARSSSCYPSFLYPSRTCLASCCPNSGRPYFWCLACGSSWVVLLPCPRVPPRSSCSAVLQRQAHLCPVHSFHSQVCVARECAQALEEMQAQGHRPDVGVYNVVIEALSRSGVLLLQLKAAQLFQARFRFRLREQGLGTTSCCGACMNLAPKPQLGLHVPCRSLVVAAVFNSPCARGGASTLA